jgi:hypothetical protein
VRAHGNPNIITNRASVTSDTCDVDLTNNSDIETTRTLGLRKLSFTPPIVTGGCDDSTGTLLLSGPAPQGGLVVNLHSSSPAVDVPPTVTVPQGQTSATFPAQTHVVQGDQIVFVTATAGSNHVGGRLKVLADRIVSVTFNPNPVHGGSDSIATITLACAADEPITVRLTSDRAAARPQSPIVIPAGQMSGQSTIHTLPVDSPRNVTITAFANGGYKRAILRIIP